jgi:hypothetical protein
MIWFKLNLVILFTIISSILASDNFINTCSGKPITKGLQVTGGSCNPVPMGDIIPKGKGTLKRPKRRAVHHARDGTLEYVDVSIWSFIHYL